MFCNGGWYRLSGTDSQADDFDGFWLRLGEGADDLTSSGDSHDTQTQYRKSVNNLLRALSSCYSEDNVQAATFGSEQLEAPEQYEKRQTETGESNLSQSGHKMKMRMMAFYMKQLAGSRSHGTPFTSDLYTRTKVVVAGRLCELLDCIVDCVQEESWDWGSGTLMRVSELAARQPLL